MSKVRFKDGEPCHHPGCLSHVTHPCEGCGRIAGGTEGMKMQDYIQDHIDWSCQTFGDGKHTMGIIKHIGKELAEIKAAPTDLFEWIDVAILAIDGAWRAGYTAQQVMEGLVLKQWLNRQRKWGPVVSEDEPIEHIRGLGSVLGEK